MFASDPSAIFTRPTYATLLALYDNYVIDVNVAEQETAQQLAEQDEFLDAVLATDVMNLTHQFLVSRGAADSDVAVFKEFLRVIWFGLYARYVTGVEATSGFEHVHLGELIGTSIDGWHSWTHLFQQEQAGALNYLGYVNVLPLDANSTTAIEIPLNWNGYTKLTSSQFEIGASPELEMAIATLCFVARLDTYCYVQAADATPFAWYVYSYTYNGVDYVGSAKPIFV